MPGLACSSEASLLLARGLERGWGTQTASRWVRSLEGATALATGRAKAAMSELPRGSAIWWVATTEVALEREMALRSEEVSAPGSALVKASSTAAMWEEHSGPGLWLALESAACSAAGSEERLAPTTD